MHHQTGTTVIPYKGHHRDTLGRCVHVAYPMWDTHLDVTFDGNHLGERAAGLIEQISRQNKEFSTKDS